MIRTMKVLTERVTWKRERPASETRRASDLTPEEQANVRTALAFLRVRSGGWAKLAAAMRVNVTTLSNAPRRAVSAGLALQAARVAGVALEAILRGEWPAKGLCAHCGRGP
jgi:hypothetical protein